MSDRVKVRVLSAFTLPGGAVAEPGTTIAIDPLVAFDISPSKGEVLHPDRALPLIEAAVQAANVEALAIEKRGQPRAAVSSWVLPSAAGYRPHAH